ncbi:hypothetical protein [Nocardia carnea]|uniref:hypothetical protein n=1 Tax=Nocardia carnea TaxID=37328 RepID=UPI002457E276|nr:hypothetical protein [Nocardia carnea]
MTRAACGRRRAIVLRRSEFDARELERLIGTHALEIVYTVVTDAGPKLGTLIAIQHVLERDAEVIVIPHLTRETVWRERPWQAVTELADLITGSGVVSRGTYGTRNAPLPYL